MLPKIIPINEKLSLKLLIPADANQLFTIANRNRAYFSQWISWINKINTLDDEIQFLEKIFKSYQEEKSAHYGLHISDNIIIGAISFNSINSETKTATIGYWLDPMYQNNGYMDLSLKALIEAAESAGLLNFIIETNENNFPSRKLAERNNFQRDQNFESRAEIKESSKIYTYKMTISNSFLSLKKQAN